MSKANRCQEVLWSQFPKLEGDLARVYMVIRQGNWGKDFPLQSVTHVNRAVLKRVSVITLVWDVPTPGKTHLHIFQFRDPCCSQEM